MKEIEMMDTLSQNTDGVFYEINQYKGSHLMESRMIESNLSAEQIMETSENIWRILLEQDKQEELFHIKTKFTLIEGASNETNVACGIRFNRWSKDNYVVMPAAAYNGNRFKSQKLNYPPIVNDSKFMGENPPTLITDIPRLNEGEGPSNIIQLSRDMSTPSIGFFSPTLKKGFWLITPQFTECGDLGFEIVESEDRRQCVIKISAPGIRKDTRYTMCDMSHPSEDRGVNFKAGDFVTIDMKLIFFDCEDIPMLMDKFTKIRKAYWNKDNIKSSMPFYSASSILIDKYNEQNWDEKYGYYRVGVGDSLFSKWQIGWVGGLISTYALLTDGDGKTRERVLENFDFVFKDGQGKSGFFYGIGDGANWYGDDLHNLENKNWHLVRKSADALYFIISQFYLLEGYKDKSDIKKLWIEGTRKCADAFVELWEKYGQFGQFVGTETGDIVVGNSTCGAMAIGGLALASKYYEDEKYLEVACKAGNYYYENYVKKGLANGGPGEICQCPDSESAFALLESYITLYEVTGDKNWIGIAKKTADLCSSWCVSYNYKFPEDSTFGKLKMESLGTVYANVQNKHSSPGICTLSGVSLFKLFRYSGDKKYLELCREITRTLPQYLSRKDRLISFLPHGWMNERVQLSDWLEPRGEVFKGSCWPEVSMLLTYAQVPGLYVQPDVLKVYHFDHVEAKIIDASKNRIELEITNTTNYDARVKVFMENATDTKKILDQNFLIDSKMVDVEPMQKVNVIMDV